MVPNEYKAKDYLTYHNLNLRAYFSTIIYHIAEVRIHMTMNHGFHGTCRVMYGSFLL
jgi:hypothetical protein